MKRVLFVCLGNICRSPTAEAVMTAMVKKAGISDKIFCDSAGTGAYHVGERADGRMRIHGKKRGYDLTSISRQFTGMSDFESFDYVLAMDEANYEDILNTDPSGKYKHKLFRMVKFCTQHDVPGVPDPYYGGDQGFETVIDILEDSCQALLEQIKRDS